MEETHFLGTCIPTLNLVAPTPLDTLLKDLAQKDFLTYQHSIAVAEHMRNFGLALGQNEEQAAEAEIFGAIHDIAKTLVDATVFRKLQSGEQLEQTERDSLVHPPEKIFELIPQDLLPPAVTEAIPQMDCRYDGKGKPELAGEQISQLARMLKICDYYDMLTRQRTGRTPLSEDQSKQVLQNNSGVLFDPNLVAVFIDQSNNL